MEKKLYSVFAFGSLMVVQVVAERIDKRNQHIVTVRPFGSTRTLDLCNPRLEPLMGPKFHQPDYRHVGAKAQ